MSASLAQYWGADALAEGFGANVNGDPRPAPLRLAKRVADRHITGPHGRSGPVWQ
ncbi:MAG: hypothetical protein ACRCVA_18345 [Phreatobacter sp.]